MTNSQNTNLQTAQNESIFAHRKDVILKEKENEQSAFWPGLQNNNIAHSEPSEVCTNINDNECNKNQLRLFPRVIQNSSDVLLYGKEKDNRNRDKFFNDFFKRNISNKSTKLLFQGIENKSGNMHSYSQCGLEAHLLFDKVLIISKHYYQISVYQIGEGDVEESETESRNIIKVIKYPSILTIANEISQLTNLCEQSILQDKLEKKDKKYKKVVEDLQYQKAQLEQTIAEKDGQIALLQKQCEHVIAEHNEQINLLQTENNQTNIMFNLALDQLVQPKGFKRLLISLPNPIRHIIQQYQTTDRMFLEFDFKMKAIDRFYS